MKDNLLYVLAGFIALSMVGIIVLLLFLFPEQRELINLSIGSFITTFAMVMSYFFGSSKGEADKNEILKK